MQKIYVVHRQTLERTSIERDAFEKKIASVSCSSLNVYSTQLVLLLLNACSRRAFCEQFDYFHSLSLIENHSHAFQ